MGKKQSWIRADHPPQGTGYIRTGRFPRKFLKATLFFFVLVLFFHLPDLDPKMSHRRETVEEILSMLESHRTGLATITKEELAEVIYEEAIRYNHDPKFIMALIFVESEYFNWAVSDKGAKGLMQIMPYVARAIAKDMDIEWAGDRTLFNPYLNIRMGIHYLSQLIGDFDDVGVALTAYNSGPTYVKGLIERKERIPLNYYQRILSIYRAI